MRNSSLISLTAGFWLLLGLEAFALASTGEKLALDPEKSTIEWVGKKLTGEHRGTVALKTGHVIVRQGRLLEAQLEIDLTKLTCTDIEDTKSNRNIVNHLKNDDFFSVDRFPTATFVLKKSTPMTGNRHRAEGLLTIKGQTQPIRFEISLSKTQKGYHATGTLHVDRTRWGIKYKSGTFFKSLGDKVIEDKFELHLSLHANKS